MACRSECANDARPSQRLGPENRRLQSRRQLIEAFSHDVRTPLTVISQYLDLLDDELSRADAEEQRQIVRVMRDRAGDLNHTFNNLLDALKFDVGKLGSSRRACKAVDLTAAVRSILERKTIAIALSRTLEFDFASDLAPIFCDADQICRVLVNLAVDALKGSSSQDGVAVWATSNGCKAASASASRSGGVRTAKLRPQALVGASPPPALPTRFSVRSARLLVSCERSFAEI